MSRATSRSLTTVGQRVEVDGHALAAGDEADDRVARDRVAALAEADEQIADALDPDATGARLRGCRHRQGELTVVDDTEPHDDRLGGDGAVADGGIEVVERVLAVGPRDLQQAVVADRRDGRSGEALQLALEGLLAVDDVLVAVLLLEPLADLLAGMGGPDDRQPVARRAVLGLRGHDLHDVAVAQPVVEGHEAVVDLRPDRRGGRRRCGSGRRSRAAWRPPAGP